MIHKRNIMLEERLYIIGQQEIIGTILSLKFGHAVYDGEEKLKENLPLDLPLKEMLDAALDS